MATIRSTGKFPAKWVRQTRKFLKFLHTTYFPSFEGPGQWGEEVASPE